MIYKPGDRIRVLKDGACGAIVYKGQICIVSDKVESFYNSIAVHSIEENKGYPKGEVWFFSPNFIELVELKVVIKCEEDYYKWLAAR